ncbi:zinc ribbon domain-containing protein [Pseudomonas sp. NPDC089569]|uniref:zinc ribbon domain-containing protein n=1 Tax=Pseudomonas sp. NPDC089569 TaxID=3390722 RepID=UPI003D037342
MDGVVAIVALAVFVGVWWWLVKQLRKSGRGFLMRHLLGCSAAWMAGLLIVGSAISMGIIESKPVEVAQKPQASNPTFKYSIVNDEHREGRPRKVEVLLSRRLTDGELADTAKAIRDDSSVKAEKTFIGFRVEGQTEKTFWANASFDPDFKSSLIGLSAQDYQTLVTMDLKAYPDMLGSWLRDGALGHVMVLYKRNGQYSIDSIFPSGGKNTENYQAKTLADGSLRLDEPENSFHEYYVVDSKGNLQGWGENGVYMTLPPTKSSL